MNMHSPLKRHEALVGFSKDHHFGLLLVWKIRQGLNKKVSPGRISDYVLYFFDEDIDGHFKEEEEQLFPMLPPSSILRQQAEAEHKAIYEMIGRLRKDKENIDLLLQFADALKDHIRFEERELFPFMQRTLSATELEQIADHGDPRGEEIDAHWHDIFWLNEKSKC